MNAQFLSNNSEVKKIQEALKALTPLNILAILIGPEHTGKKSLIKSIFPSHQFINAKNKKTLIEALKNKDKLVIYNFENIISFDELDLSNKQIIAIANDTIDSKIVQNFAFKFYMPSLKDRKDDLKILTDLFLNRAKKDLNIDKNIKINISKIDISENNLTLKASIYEQLFTKTLDREKLKEMIKQYFLDNLKEGNGYYENIDIFDEAIIKAGLKKYKSQLKLSKILGINRNTLRKKIEEYNID